MPKKRKNQIVDVTVMGGCVDVSNVPDGINVVVWDYDVESYRGDDRRLKKDTDGTPYIRRVFGK